MIKEFLIIILLSALIILSYSYYIETNLPDIVRIETVIEYVPVEKTKEIYYPCGNSFEEVTKTIELVENFKEFMSPQS